MGQSIFNATDKAPILEGKRDIKSAFTEKSKEKNVLRSRILNI